MRTYLVVVLGAALLSVAFTFLVIRLARRFGLVDKPGVRKVHKSAVPRVGGAAIFAGMLAMVLPVLLLDNVIGASFRQYATQIIGLLATGAVIFLVGLVDDVRGLRARTKLTAQVFCAVVMYSLGVRIDELTIPLLGPVKFGLLSLPITVIWIAGITNALNLIDGLDGLAAGIAMITCVVLASLAIMLGEPVMAVLMLALAGSLAGFLVFNFNPARIFMGDSGSLLLGFLLGTSSVLCAMKSAAIVGLAVPLVAMGVPIFDLMFSMARRMLDRRSPFAPDRAHIHHRLLDMGLSHRNAVLALYGVTLSAGLVGLALMGTRDWMRISVFAVAVAFLIGVFRIAGAMRLRESYGALRRNMAIAGQVREERRFFEDCQLRVRESRTFDGWWSAVCDAAGQLGVEKLSVTIVDDRCDEIHRFDWADGKSGAQPDDGLWMHFRVSPPDARRRAFVEAQIGIRQSIEAAARRGAWLSRLLEEHQLEQIPSIPAQPRLASAARMPATAQEVSDGLLQPA